MLGRFLGLPLLGLLLVGLGILLGTTEILLLDYIAATLFLIGNTILIVLVLLVLAILVEGVLFRAGRRWGRFN